MKRLQNLVLGTLRMGQVFISKMELLYSQIVLLTPIPLLAVGMTVMAVEYLLGNMIIMDWILFSSFVVSFVKMK